MMLKYAQALPFSFLSTFFTCQKLISLVNGNFKRWDFDFFHTNIGVKRMICKR